MNRGGFSWKRLLGISRMKSNLSRQIGIPLSRSGRDQKIGRLITKGCTGVVLLFLCGGVAISLVLIRWFS